MNTKAVPHLQSPPNIEPPMATIEVRKIVIESVPLASGGTSSMGEILDQMLYHAAERDEVIQTITLGFPDEGQWFSYARGLRGRYGISEPE